MSSIKVYIKLLFRLARILGLWSNKENFLKPSLYLYYGTLILIIMILHTVPICVNMFFFSKNVFDFLSVAFIVTQLIGIFPKIYFFVKYWELLMSIMKDLDSPTFQPKTEKQKRIMQSIFFVWKVFFTTFIAVAHLVTSNWTIAPYVSNMRTERKLMYPAWYPFDYTKTPYYDMVHIFQMLACHLIGLAHTVLDGLMSALLAYIAAECSILADSTENIDYFAKLHVATSTGRSIKDIKDEEIFDIVDDLLVDCIKHHQEILRFSKRVSIVVNYNIFIVYVTCLITMCVCLLAMSMVEPMSSEFLTFALLVMATFIQISQYCWMGNETILRSQSIAEAAFKTKWIATSKSYRKNLIYFMHQTQQPIKIYAVNIFLLSLDTLTATLRMSFSYYTALSRTSVFAK